jgi:3-hydroxyacyl-CoA dehydrogenase
MQDIAIVGAGLMGLGIAQVAAAAGVCVRLVGRDAAASEAGHARLAAQLSRQVDRGRLALGEAQALLARVLPVYDDGELADCGLAIESVPEQRALKAAVLQRLQAALPEHALIATNTSGLPVSGLAAALSRPERFVGLHFFSPVERMKLVEVVRGAQTSEATLNAALAFVVRIRQTPIVVRDGPGFFTSRVFAAYLDEALALLAEGQDPVQIEAAARTLGRAVGPLALLDDISLALNLQQIEQAQADGLPPERCRPLAAPVLAQMIAAGRGGRRQGGGFFDTDADGTRTLWAGLAERFPRAAEALPTTELCLRLRLAEVMEALRCLEQGVIASADDADTGSVRGLGFPPASGGVLGWAEQQGLPALVSQADELARIHGPRFLPSPWLRDVAASGQGLQRWRTPHPKRTTSP